MRVNVGRKCSRRPQSHSLLGKPVSLFGLVCLTVVQTCIRPHPARVRCLLRLTTHSRLTLRTPPLRLGVEPDFIPASRIEGQSLPWGKCSSPFTSAVGKCAPYRTLSCLEWLSSSLAPHPSPSLRTSISRK